MNKWLIAVGASGQRGLQDICALLGALPANLNAVVLIVLHRPWAEDSHLAEVLARHALMPVTIAGQGDRVEPGHVYIGEPQVHLTLLERNFALMTSDRERTKGNRTVDLLFESLALCGGGKTIGVVLSGALDDGSRGLSAIHHAGGHTMVKSPEDANNNGMRENAIKYDGPVNLIGSMPELSAAIIALVNK